MKNRIERAALALLSAALVFTIHERASAPERAELIPVAPSVSAYNLERVEPRKEHDPAKPYTDEDAHALAKMAWGECRGVQDLIISGKLITKECQQAATMWCALNRYDTGKYDSIIGVLEEPGQFHGYDQDNPVDADLLVLAYDVLDRWAYEQSGGTDLGRVLPAEYLFFSGDGYCNYFTKNYQSSSFYTWELTDIYGGNGI